MVDIGTLSLIILLGMFALIVLALVDSRIVIHRTKLPGSGNIRYLPNVYRQQARGEPIRHQRDSRQPVNPRRTLTLLAVTTATTPFTV